MNIYLLYGTDSLNQAAKVYEKIKAKALAHGNGKEAQA